MYWLIQMHTIMNLNCIAMNTTTYNSCYFDMNCMLLVFSWCWLTHDEWMANTTIFNSCHFNKNCIVMITLIDTSAWYHELHCCVPCCNYFIKVSVLSTSIPPGHTSNQVRQYLYTSSVSHCLIFSHCVNLSQQRWFYIFTWN